MEILFLSATVICCYLGVKLDPDGEKPYVIFPVVVGIMFFLSMQIIVLINLYPIAVKHDKKVLKKKTFKFVEIQDTIDELKQKLCLNFENDNGIYQTCTSDNFSVIKNYSLFFIEQKDIGELISLIKNCSHGRLSSNIQHKGARYINIYFIEIASFTKDIKTLEETLDMQYLYSNRLPIEVVIPLLYEKNLNRLYYYEKWSKFNLSLLATGTRFVKKILNIKKTRTKQKSEL